MQETANFNHSVQDELDRLLRQLADLEGMLRAQHDILRQRGMSIPTSVLENVYYVRQDVETLKVRIASETIEVDQLRAVAETTRLITSSLDPDQVLDGVIDTAIALIGAERGYIVLRDSETGELRFRVARDYHRRTLDAERFAGSRTIMLETAESGQPKIEGDAMSNERFDPNISIVQQALRSIICVPLIYKDQVTGVLYADNRQIANLFGQRESDLLLAFANQAAVAIENARLFARVRRALVEITEMKDLMDNVLASIASGVITTDRQHTIVIYNQAAEKILGVPHDEAVGQPLDDVLPDLFTGFDELVAAVHEGDRQRVIEIEPVLPQRGAVNLSLKLSPLKNAQGEIDGMAVVVDDLTEIKKREATLSVVRSYLPWVDKIETVDAYGLSGDEREISVIFADVRGFTTFSEQLDPEQLMTVISKYLTLSSDAIQLYEGIIDKYMGDAVVGLFNTQLNPQRGDQEDHAVRAVRAALSMAYDVQALHQVLPPGHRLFYGIGVDTGWAMLGNVGSPSRKEFTAIGVPFNFAKLLQENAQAGEIIISDRIYQRVQGVFVTEALQPRKIKGHTDFHVMHRVTGVRPRT